MFCLRIQVHEDRYVSTPSSFLSLASTGSSILRCVVSCHRARLETSTCRNCPSCICECCKGAKCVLFVSAFACQWKIATWATKCISWACSWLTVWRSCWYVHVMDAFISRSAATTLRQPNPTPPWPSEWHSLCLQILPVGLLLLFSDLQLWQGTPWSMFHTRRSYWYFFIPSTLVPTPTSTPCWPSNTDVTSSPSSADMVFVRGKQQGIKELMWVSRVATRSHRTVNLPP